MQVEQRGVEKATNATDQRTDTQPDGQALDLSIVVCNYNAAEHLRRLLASVPEACAGLRYEVIVVDNASRRGNVGAAVTGVPHVRLVRRRTNGGFSKGVNAGIRRARAEAVLVINPDAWMAPGSAAALVAHLKAQPQIGALGPRVENEDGSLQYSCRRFPTPMTALFNRYSLLTRLRPENKRSSSYLMSDWDHASVADVDWVSAAAVMLRRSALMEAGLFDEGYFFTMEDVDLCQRLHTTGWRVVYDPHAMVRHRIGGSSRTAPVRVAIARHAAMWRYYRHHLSRNALIDGVALAAIVGRCGMVLSKAALARARDIGG